MGWVYAKLALIVALTVYHHALARWRQDFAADANSVRPGSTGS